MKTCPSTKYNGEIRRARASRVTDQSEYSHLAEKSV